MMAGDLPMCHIYIVLFSQVKETHKPLLFVEDLGGGYVTSSLYNPATFETHWNANLMLLAVQQIGIIYILLAVPTTERDYVTHEADFVDSVPHFVECSPCVTVKNYAFVFLDLHHG
jgi:hypothetical protein